MKLPDRKWHTVPQQLISSVVDLVFPPDLSHESWLRGILAKFMIRDVFEGKQDDNDFGRQLPLATNLMDNAGGRPGGQLGPQAAAGGLRRRRWRRRPASPCRAPDLLGCAAHVRSVCVLSPAPPAHTSLLTYLLLLTRSKAPGQLVETRKAPEPPAQPLARPCGGGPSPLWHY
jgi:hypothetical protein